MVSLQQAALHALQMVVLMAWEIFWPLVLGFALSAIVQAVVPKGNMSRLLPDASFRSLSTACLLGAASSSCSYAAVALTRSLIRKGADFVAGMAFQLASTNLVVELGIILAVLMGWQFTAAEFSGGFLMVGIVAVLFRKFASEPLLKGAVDQANRGVQGRMEGHAAMDMSVTEGPLFRRMLSEKGRTAISHYFVMDWEAIWKDIVLGLLIAGAASAWIPRGVWSTLFLQAHPAVAKFWGPMIGPLIAVISFVCSVGNVPLAAVLWNGGISFGGVIAFIFADLLVIPILDIYRKYYGWKMMSFIFGIYYIAMVVASLIVKFAFDALGWIPQQRNAQIVGPSIQFNYTTVLNIVFGALALSLVIKFFRTGGSDMLKHMKADSSQTHKPAA